MVTTDRIVMIDAPQNLMLSGIRELSRGNDGEALEAFTEALKGRSPLGDLCSARLHILRRQYAAAQALLENLIGREPDLAEAHFLLGQVHLASCRLFEAIASYRMAVALDPDDQRAASALSDLLDVQEP